MRTRPLHALQSVSDLLFCLCLASSVAVGASALAQTGSTPDGRGGSGAAPARSEAPAPSRPDLAERPFSIPSLGLSLHLPQDSVIESSRIEGMKTSIIVRPPEAKAAWVMQIHNSASSDTSLTLGAVVDSIIAQHQNRRIARDPASGRNVGSYVRAFDRVNDLHLGEIPAQRVYFDTPSEPSEPVTGYTVMQTGPGRFVIIQLDCPRERFETGIRHLYEMVAASVTARDTTEVNVDRAAAIRAASALLESAAAEDLEACLDEEPVFYRVYRAAPTGSSSDAEELAWQRIHMRLGQLGELNPRKGKEHWSTEEREFGYLVRADARSLMGGALLDSEGVFFLSRDRAQERWTIRNVVRRGEQTQHLTLTVVRRDRRMTVLTDETGQPPKTLEYNLPEQGYVSKVETYLLPRLVALKNMPANLAFYTYDAGLGKVALRRETFALANAAASTWEQQTRFTEDVTIPVVTSLDPRGRILRQQLSDGQIMEPIEQERLKRLWEGKSLPLPEPGPRQPVRRR